MAMPATRTRQTGGGKRNAVVRPPASDQGTGHVLPEMIMFWSLGLGTYALGEDVVLRCAVRVPPSSRHGAEQIASDPARTGCPVRHAERDPIKTPGDLNRPDVATRTIRQSRTEVAQ